MPKYDPAASNALLDSAGWHRGPGGVRYKNGQPLELSMLVRRGDDEKLATVIAAEAGAVGIRLRVKLMAIELENSPSGPIMQGHFQVAIFSIASDADPDPSWLFACDQMPPAGDNIARYCNAHVDVLQEQAASTYDREKRKALSAKIQR